MNINFKKPRGIHLAILIGLIVILGIASSSRYVFALNNNEQNLPTYEVKAERTINNYTIDYPTDERKGNLYELSVLVDRKVTEDTAMEYAGSIIAPENTVAVNVKFYSSYDEKTKRLHNLEYEIEKKYTK